MRVGVGGWVVTIVEEKCNTKAHTRLVGGSGVSAGLFAAALIDVETYGWTDPGERGCKKGEVCKGAGLVI